MATKTKQFLKILEYISEHGKSRYIVECSCGEQFEVYVWSIAGRGKKCPKCGYVYGPADLHT